MAVTDWVVIGVVFGISVPASLWTGGCGTVIEIAAVLIAVGVIVDAALIALADVRFERRRVDRRWKRG